MLSFNCPEQLSGFADIHLFLISETGNWPVVLTDDTSSQIIFTPEFYSLEALVDEDSISIEAVQKEPDVFEITALFSFVTRSEALEQMLDQYQNKECIVLACLNTRRKKLYGSDQQPLFMQFEIDEGMKVDDRGRTKVKITGKTRTRPVFYSGVDSY